MIPDRWGDLPEPIRAGPASWRRSRRRHRTQRGRHITHRGRVERFGNRLDEPHCPTAHFFTGFEFFIGSLRRPARRAARRPCLGLYTHEAARFSLTFPRRHLESAQSATGEGGKIAEGATFRTAWSTRRVSCQNWRFLWGIQASGQGRFSVAICPLGCRLAVGGLLYTRKACFSAYFFGRDGGVG